MPDSNCPAMIVKDLDFHYGNKKVLENVSLNIPRQQVMALIGPSGCGKSTLLRCFNRMNDKVEGARITQGTITIEGQNIMDPHYDVISLRRDVGMVFQKSNPFPQSIYENVVYGLRVRGFNRRSELDAIVEESLRKSALWEETKDRLHSSAMSLSGGQMQRLCIARAIATKPKILLMDEPCSALDPVSTLKVEDMITQLKHEYTIVVVTHNMEQATRVSDRTAFFFLGKLIEEGETTQIFNIPKEKQTFDYVTGRSA